MKTEKLRPDGGGKGGATAFSMQVQFAGKVSEDFERQLVIRDLVSVKTSAQPEYYREGMSVKRLILQDSSVIKKSKFEKRGFDSHHPPHFPVCPAKPLPV